MRRRHTGPWFSAADAGYNRLMIQGLWRRLVFSHLGRITEGSIHLHEAEGSRVFGSGHPGEPAIHVRVRHPGFYGKLLWRSDTGAGLSYAHGQWTTDDLVGLIRLLIRNSRQTENLQNGLLTRLAAWYQRARQFLERNTPAGSRRNIMAHYDLGNDFFATFLDPSLTYSCGIFPHEGASLAEASAGKYERICRLLELQPEHEVLEIGCGWGGFALHAAARHGCRVVAVTISPRQFAVATRRVAEAGLQDRVRILREDYRNLPAKLDRRFARVVSIEMIEAVGHGFLDAYFTVCSRMLRRDGAMLLQGILMRDDLHRRYLHSVDFIRACIFPGGSLPSRRSIARSLARSTDLRVSSLDEITEHYPRTLLAWRRRLLAGQEALVRAGYPHELILLWEFYFCYCAAGFMERRIDVAQILLSKPEHRPSPIRPELPAPEPARRPGSRSRWPEPGPEPRDAPSAMRSANG